MKVCWRCMFLALVLVSMTSDHGAARTIRAKRAVGQFADMIAAATKSKTLKDFNKYGQFCGILGNGVPVDNIDRCCHQHDKCLKPINRQTCLPFFYVAFFVIPYSWYTVRAISDSVHNTIVCSSSNSNCQFALCQCDKKAVDCFARYEDEYNPLNRS